MACLVNINYDPATAVAGTTKSLGAALAMTAIDTTNLRASFTAPASGKVMVRCRVAFGGGTTLPAILLGVLAGAAIIFRQAPQLQSIPGTIAATTVIVAEVIATVSVTPGAALVWDMAYGVETLATSAGLRYGGPNDATASNAYGAATFEVWDA
jgi:hypothetical protein